MKKLAKKLDENPIGSRCLNVPDCISLVKKNHRPTVFIHVIKLYTSFFIVKKIHVYIERELICICNFSPLDPW